MILFLYLYLHCSSIFLLLYYLDCSYIVLCVLQVDLIAVVTSQLGAAIYSHNNTQTQHIETTVRQQAQWW